MTASFLDLPDVPRPYRRAEAAAALLATGYAKQAIRTGSEALALHAGWLWWFGRWTARLPATDPAVAAIRRAGDVEGNTLLCAAALDELADAPHTASPGPAVFRVTLDEVARLQQARPPGPPPPFVEAREPIPTLALVRLLLDRSDVEPPHVDRKCAVVHRKHAVAAYLQALPESSVAKLELAVAHDPFRDEPQPVSRTTFAFMRCAAYAWSGELPDGGLPALAMQAVTALLVNSPERGTTGPDHSCA